MDFGGNFTSTPFEINEKFKIYFIRFLFHFLSQLQQLLTFLFQLVIMNNISMLVPRQRGKLPHNLQDSRPSKSLQRL